jgi:hypothetical protein
MSATPAWIQAYESAVVELDRTKLRDRIFEAKHAIFDRIEELQKNDAGAEAEKLRIALQALDDLSGLAARDGNNHNWSDASNRNGLHTT